MHIQLDSRNPNSIISYSDSQLNVGEVIYKESLLLSRESIISPWPVHSLSELTEAVLQPILQNNPEIILIGHSRIEQRLPFHIQAYLSQQRIGFECMSIGAACRTFNLLLSEGRACVVGIIF